MKKKYDILSKFTYQKSAIDAAHIIGGNMVIEKKNQTLSVLPYFLKWFPL